MQALYTNWDDGEPVYIEDQNCATVESPDFNNHLNDLGFYVQSAYGAFWDDAACKEMHRAVCQVPASRFPSASDLQKSDV